jgi:acetolactate synthase-1/2/3 large subunit
VARFLRERGVDRVFGLQGGHIQPIWDQFARGGVPIVDVRDEGAAVHMAHAHSELTGQTGAALATAGPGVTNAITAVANASVSRIPLVLIGGCPPRPQVGMGPLQAALGVRVTFEVVDPHTLTLAEHKSRRVVDQRDHLRR